jgi:hypothetical protein
MDLCPIESGRAHEREDGPGPCRARTGEQILRRPQARVPPPQGAEGLQRATGVRHGRVESVDGGGQRVDQRPVRRDGHVGGAGEDERMPGGAQACLPGRRAVFESGGHRAGGLPEARGDAYFAVSFGSHHDLRETRAAERAQYPGEERFAAELRARLVAAEPAARRPRAPPRRRAAGHQPTRAAKIFRSAGDSRTRSSARRVLRAHSRCPS